MLQWIVSCVTLTFYAVHYPFSSFLLYFLSFDVPTEEDYTPMSIYVHFSFRGGHEGLTRKLTF
jgi:hypothetical protein